MYRTEWVKFTQEEREKLKAHFGLKATRSVEVVNNVLITDGVPDESLMKITVKEANKVLETNSNENVTEEPKAKVIKKRVSKKAKKVKSA